MGLIKINENQGNQVVNARDLHEYLESKQDFSDWIKKRIKEYGFVENEDFALSHNSMEQKGKGGHNRKDYAISLDMAKELSMVERNDKGRQARKYFIEVEKTAFKEFKNTLSSATTRTLNQTGEAIISNCKVIQKRLELLKVIRFHLNKGDRKIISEEMNYSESLISQILRGGAQNSEVLAVLYQKAMKNKEELLFKYDEMINELKN